jgi:excisionase family DNA binding protein
MNTQHRRALGHPGKISPAAPATVSVADQCAPGHPGVEPIAVRIREACRISGLSRTYLYMAHKAGRLPFIKVGAGTLIPMDALKALVASLPVA